ncbi:hypothetical protein I308_100446 [Cryptococcus tetragattii IND107]|uniref:Uncharacterized protein n=1 Tax=Cryptococcus tetragattii IND107 TaxID=1296105 RepID=A0ABR3C4U5_9TREE
MSSASSYYGHCPVSSLISKHGTVRNTPREEQASADDDYRQILARDLRESRRDLLCTLRPASLFCLS